MGNVIQVRHVADALERAAAYRLRYRVYIEEMNMPLLSANHQSMTVIDDIDEDSLLYIACDPEGQVIGTLRLLIGSEKTLDVILSSLRIKTDSALNLKPDQFCFSGRLAIHKEWRSSNALNALVTMAYKVMYEQGVLLDIMVCTPGLIGLYEHMGYRRLKHAVYFPDLGYRIPMALLLSDRIHLKKVRSPFLKINSNDGLNKRDNSEGIINQLNIRCHKHTVDTHLINIMGRVAKGVDYFFNDIDASNIAIFLSHFEIIDVSIGDSFIVSDTIGDEAFYILSGCVITSTKIDLLSKLDGQGALLPGNLVGTHEFLFPGRRRASATAGSDLTLLVIDHASYTRFSKRHPNIAAILDIRIEQSEQKDNFL